MNEISTIIEVILYANLAAFAIFVGLNLHRRAWPKLQGTPHRPVEITEPKNHGQDKKIPESPAKNADKPPGT